MRSPGFVYVMVNPRSPHLVRVGKSTRPPEYAAQEANLQLEDAAYFADCTVAEGFVHERLSTFHATDDPELFEVPVEVALKALSDAMKLHVGTRSVVRENVQQQHRSAAAWGYLKWVLLFIIAAAVGAVVPAGLRLLDKNNSANASETTEAPTDAASVASDGADAADAATPVKLKPRSEKAKKSADASTIARVPAAGASDISAPRIVTGNEQPPAAPTPEVQSLVNQAPPQAPPAEREIPAEELREQFVWSKEKADAAFIDSTVKFSAPVTKVGKHDLQFKKIKCKFDGDPPDGIAAGTTVSVEGTVRGKSRWTGTINMDHCRVLP
jgi:hypothetical protein